MEIEQLKPILEAAILAAGEPISLERLQSLFQEKPSKGQLKQALDQLQTDYQGRGVHLIQLASGYCFQTASNFSEWVKGLWPEKRARYSRAFLETLAIIAYKQPITRGDIESIRGISVSPNIMRSLIEHEWIESVGQREVPGRPHLYATTKYFLNHFNLTCLEDLPPLTEVSNSTVIQNTASPKTDVISDATESESINS